MAQCGVSMLQQMRTGFVRKQTGIRPDGAHLEQTDFRQGQYSSNQQCSTNHQSQQGGGYSVYHTVMYYGIETNQTVQEQQLSPNQQLPVYRHQQPSHSGVETNRTIQQQQPTLNNQQPVYSRQQPAHNCIKTNHTIQQQQPSPTHPQPGYSHQQPSYSYITVQSNQIMGNQYGVQQPQSGRINHQATKQRRNNNQQARAKYDQGATIWGTRRNREGGGVGQGGKGSFQNQAQIHQLRKIQHQITALNNIQRYLSTYQLPSGGVVNHQTPTGTQHRNTAWNQNKARFESRPNLTNTIHNGVSEPTATNLVSQTTKTYFRPTNFETSQMQPMSTQFQGQQQRCVSRPFVNVHVANQVSPSSNVDDAQMEEDEESVVLKPFVDLNRIKMSMNEMSNEVSLANNSSVSQQSSPNDQGQSCPTGSSTNILQRADSSDEVAHRRKRSTPPTPRLIQLLTASKPIPQPAATQQPHLLSLLLPTPPSSSVARSRSVGFGIDKTPKDNFIRPSSAPNSQTVDTGSDTLQTAASTTSQGYFPSRFVKHTNSIPPPSTESDFRESKVGVTSQCGLDLSIHSKLPNNPHIASKTVQTNPHKKQSSSTSERSLESGSPIQQLQSDCGDAIGKVGFSVNLAEAFSTGKLNTVKVEKQLDANDGFLQKEKETNQEKVSHASDADVLEDEDHINKIQEDVEALLQMGLPDYKKLASTSEDAFTKIVNKKMRNNRSRGGGAFLLKRKSKCPRRWLPSLSDNDALSTDKEESQRETDDENTPHQNQDTPLLPDAKRENAAMKDPSSRKRTARIALPRSKSPRMDLVYEHRLSKLREEGNRGVSPSFIARNAGLLQRIIPCQVWMTDIFSTKASVVRITKS